MATPTLNVMIELAEGVKAKLDQQTMSFNFEAIRDWVAQVDREDLEKHVVTVIPDSKTARAASRMKRANTVTIDVAVRRRFGGAPSEGPNKKRCDQTASLTQEIDDFLVDPANEIVTPTFRAVPRQSDQYFIHDDLCVERCMTMYVTMTYEFIR